MLLSLNWLREFVPYQGTPEALSDKLTMVGLEVEGIVKPFDVISSIVVGYVAECAKLEDSDHLSACKVDVGTEVLDIVCGAPNVAQGLKVAVVKVGTTLPDGKVITKNKLRGMTSSGMICSELELGLSENHSGIMVLDEKAVPGSAVINALGLDDDILDISITPNRGDCLSVFGLAREVALITGLPLNFPSVTLQESSARAEDAVSIEVLDGDLCPAYYGRVIDNIRVGTAPAWMRYRLNACGVRSISNIVDITNYVMLELGQPLHAFDLDKVAGHKVSIRGAKDGEKLVTLDEQERELCAGDILICDAEKPICLGGVMGGQSTEITSESSRVFLEGAVFAPWQIRRTARRLGLQSESSFRNERGIDQTKRILSVNRAAELMAQCAGGVILSGVPGVEKKPWKAQPINFSIKNCESLLGIPLGKDFCKQTLEALDCSIAEGAESWSVTAPGARTDITREADLIEEIARIYGVDKIPAVLPAIARPLDRAGLPETRHKFISRIKHWAAGVGLNETVNYSFAASKLLDKLSIAEEGRIYLQNPLSEDMDVLRPELAPNVFTAMRTSLSQGAAAVRIFETACVFLADESSETKAREPMRLALLLTGSRNDRVWPNSKGDLEYADVKGIVEHLFHFLHLDNISFTLAEKSPEYLTPAVSIQSKEHNFGYLGQLTDEVADLFHAKKEVWYAELDLDALYAASKEGKLRFKELEVYPSVRRDITFIVNNRRILGQTILDTIATAHSPILEDASLIDCFEPEGKNERNLTVRLTFRSASRTLKENEADKQRDMIAQKLCKELSIQV